MSDERSAAAGGVSARIGEAERTLAAAAEAAAAAEKRAEAEIRALEADLEKYRAAEDRDLKALELATRKSCRRSARRRSGRSPPPRSG